MVSLLHLTTQSMACRSSKPAATNPKMSWRMVSLLLAVLLALLPPRPVLASTAPLVLDISASVGPIAVQLNITKPVLQPNTGLFNGTLHMHAHDESQTPVFNADLVATGQAADSNVLLGGFLPAALIVKQDELAGMTFQQASADAQAKTGITVTFFNDASMAEYGLLLALIAIVCISQVHTIQPTLGDQACAIRAQLEAGLTALGFQNSPDPCGRGGGIVP